MCLKTRPLADNISNTYLSAEALVQAEAHRAIIT